MRNLILSITLITVNLFSAQQKENDVLIKYHNKVIEVKKVSVYNENGYHIKDELIKDEVLIFVNKKIILFRRPDGEDSFRNLSKQKYNPSKKGYEYSSEWGTVFIDENFDYINFYDSDNFGGKKYTYYIKK